MKDYSKIIAEIMQHIETEIEYIDPGSLDRSRLYRNIHTSIVANVKCLAELEPQKRYSRAVDLFREQLKIEIGRGKQKR